MLVGIGGVSYRFSKKCHPIGVSSGNGEYSIAMSEYFVKSEGYLHVQYLGVSENSVPLNPMVLLIIIPIKWLFHWEYTQHFQTNPFVESQTTQKNGIEWNRMDLSTCWINRME